MTRRAIPHPTLITRINVTPIIDVALVLVIILLVTAPMLSVADLPVNLPQAHTREAEDQRNVSVTIGRDGQLALDDHHIVSGDLRDALTRRLARPGEAGVLVVVRAAGDPAPTAAARSPQTQPGAEIAASTEQHFRRTSRPEAVDPTPQSDAAAVDRLNARLAAIQSDVAAPVASVASVGAPSAVWSTP